MSLSGCSEDKQETKPKTTPTASQALQPSEVPANKPTVTTEKVSAAPRLPAPKPSIAQKVNTDPVTTATVQRLRAENVQRLDVSRGARFITLVNRGGVVQTIDGSRGRIIAEHRLAPNRLCQGRAISRDGRRVLIRSKKTVFLDGLFDSQRYFEGKRNVRRPSCTLDGDGFHVVEVSTAEAKITHIKNKTERTFPPPDVTRIRRILTDRTARIVVGAAQRDGQDIWLVYGGTGGKFWRELSRERGGQSMALSASGRWFVSAYGETKLQLWDLHSDTPIAEWPHRRVFQFQGGDDRVLVEGNDGNLKLIDRKTGEPVASLAPEFSLDSAAVDASGQRFIAVGHGGRPQKQIIGSWDVDSSAALFVKRFPHHEIHGLAWTSDALRITTKRTDLVIEQHTGREPSRPPTTIPTVDGTELTREGRSKQADVRVRMGTHDAAALGNSGTVLVSHRMQQPLVDAVWRATAAASPEALILVDDQGTIVLKDRQATQVNQLPDPVLALTSDTRGGVFGISRKGAILRLDALGAPSTIARLPRRVSSADIDITNDGKTAVVVSGSQGYRVQLSGTASVSKAFVVPPVARHAAISGDGEHVAVSDGVDVFTYNGRNEHVAVIRLQPSGRTVVTSIDDKRLLPKEARASVRLRQGDRLMPRGQPAEVKAWDMMTSGDIPL